MSGQYREADDDKRSRLNGNGEDMNNDAVRVNQIDFRKTIPSLRLFEALGLAFSVQCLVPAFLGVLATTAIDAAIPKTAPNGESMLNISSVAQQLQMPVHDFHDLVILGFSNGFRPAMRLPLLLLGSRIHGRCHFEKRGTAVLCGSPQRRFSVASTRSKILAAGADLNHASVHNVNDRSLRLLDGAYDHKIDLRD